MNCAMHVLLLGMLTGWYLENMHLTSMVQTTSTGVEKWIGYLCCLTKSSFGLSGEFGSRLVIIQLELTDK